MSEALEHYEHAYEALRKLPSPRPSSSAMRSSVGPGGAQAQALPGSGGEAQGGREDRA